MNYLKIYNQLCTRAFTREMRYDVRYECHHIIPRSLGGTDESTNRCFLTVREHFLAHLILAYAGGPEFNTQWSSVEAMLKDSINPNRRDRYNVLRYKQWIRRRIAKYKAEYNRKNRALTL